MLKPVSKGHGVREVGTAKFLRRAIRAFVGESIPAFSIPVFQVGSITLTIPRFAATPEFITGSGRD
jgi:hypothetical protein